VVATGLDLLAEAAGLVCASTMLGARRHDAATSALTEDQPEVGEVAQRLPHDAPRHAVAGLQRLLGRQRRSRRQGVAVDLVLERIADLRVQRHTGGAAELGRRRTVV
jgi:hypothetical protein